MKDVKDTISSIEKLRAQVCNLPLIFSEIFKDEINANDEYEIYNNILGLLKKYGEDKSAMKIINDFTRALTGGASVEEILQVVMDEAVNPTMSSAITVDDECRIKH